MTTCSSTATTATTGHTDQLTAADAFIGVPLAEVGVWDASTGQVELTTADLADAVAAQDYLPSPVIKLGHTDPRFNADNFDADPAVGRVVNLRTTNNGRTLVGDLVDIPTWFADEMVTAFPQRSIEATAPLTVAGKRFAFAVTALALLGSTWPAVSSLADLRDLYSTN